MIIRAVIILALSILLSGCSIYRFVGTLAGNRLAAEIAPRLPAPKAKVIVKERGGSFCGTMTALGWPLHSTAEDKVHLKALSRATKEPILGAQLHGKAECPTWRRPNG